MHKLNSLPIVMPGIEGIGWSQQSTKVRSRNIMSTCYMIVIASLGGIAMLPQAAALGSTSTYKSSWDSSPFNLQSVTDNNLGLLCKTCSEFYCLAGVNGLDLWISFEEVCEDDPQPYFQALETDKVLATDTWSFTHACFICGLISLVALFLGFKVGSALGPVAKRIICRPA